MKRPKLTIKMIRTFRRVNEKGEIKKLGSDIGSHLFFRNQLIFRKRGKPMTMGDFRRMSNKKVLKRIIKSLRRVENE